MKNAVTEMWDRIDSLCWTCRKATATRCGWLQNKETDGRISAVRYTNYSRTRNQPLYRVIACLNYEEGELDDTDS